VEKKPVPYISPSELAIKLGCSPNTIGRAARRAGCGIYTHGGNRLAALHPDEVAKVRLCVHETSGNPVWIAAGRTTAKARRRKSS
jgi:hypothetical protein